MDGGLGGRHKDNTEWEIHLVAFSLKFAANHHPQNPTVSANAFDD